MRALKPEEKLATVFVYTPTMLFRGDLIVMQSMRVSIWLRTQGVPNFIHLHNANVVQLGGSPAKTFTKTEVFVPTSDVIGFHLSPPTQDELDYDKTEQNRRMESVHVVAGTFELRANLRVSSAADFAASLDVMTTGWISLYDAEVTNPYLPQLRVTVPMLLVRPNKIVIGLGS